MPSVVGDTSARSWGQDTPGSLRRSARLSSSSPHQGRTDRVRTPRSETISRVRLQDKGRASTGAPDASAWGSSLYSAQTSRDASLVSSYYLRSQPEAPLDESASFADESNASEAWNGLGSLLRGSQRPPQTPKSYVRNASILSGEADDYTQEDQFMAQVENQWQDNTAEADSHPFAGQARNGIPATPGMQTPHVPGVFRSARRARRVDHVDPNESQATEEPSFHVEPDAKPSRASMFEKPQEPETKAHASLGAIPKVLLALGILAVVYYILMASLSGVSVPWPSKESTAPLVEKPWPSSSTSVDKLRKRVDTLENAVNKVWRSFGDVGAEMKQTHHTLSERLRALEGRTALSSTVQALESEMRALRAAHSEGAALWAEEKKQTEALLARLAVVEQRGGGASGTLSSDAAESIRAKLGELEVRITRAARQAQQADHAASEAKGAVDALRAVVPEQMPVRYDPQTKQLRVDPALYHELRKVLGSDAPRTSTKPGSWSSFLDANRAELETLFASTVKEHLNARTSSGALLDRDAFLALLQTELARAKTELSTCFNENVHSLQSEILGKVRQQQEMYERSGSWEAPSFLHESVRANDEVSAMIHAALATFAADQIAQADYAQYSAGGRVIPALTSPTHELRLGGENVQSVLSMLQSLLPIPAWPGQKSGSYAVRGRMPVVALHHDNSPGMCWPFSGTHGQLGIQLVRKVRVSSITIDHLPAVLALDGLTSAPRDMEAWGILETDAERRQLAQWRAKRARMHADDVEPTPVPPSPSHVYLGSFSYDLQGAAIQTFPVSAEGAALGLRFRVVQLSVLSNHGLRDFTCLYRVRVHGEPAE